MTFTDIIGATGVFLILLAYLLQIANRVKLDSPVYLFLNLLGAGLACAASVMLQYWPFIILESAWVVATLVAIVKTSRQD